MILKTKTRAFTLLELLIVVAIIGILAGIVLLSMGSARKKGNNAAIKAQMSQMRGAAEIYNDDNGSYASWCTSAQAAKLSQGCTNDGGTGFNCNDNAAEWAAGITLSGTGAGYWCVDSNGTSASAHKSVGATVCP